MEENNMIDMDLIKAAIKIGRIDEDMAKIIDMLIVYNITKNDQNIEDMVYSLAYYAMNDEDEEE
jgi:hypothetical protein|tara:strand:- start:12410 stop:12601 length:192 start_codon:yes stop_codon:yes gene_type:complete